MKGRVGGSTTGGKAALSPAQAWPGLQVPSSLRVASLAMQAADRWVPRFRPHRPGSSRRRRPRGPFLPGPRPQPLAALPAGLRRAALSARRQTPGQDTCGETVRAHSALWGFSVSASKTKEGEAATRPASSAPFPSAGPPRPWARSRPGHGGVGLDHGAGQRRRLMGRAAGWPGGLDQPWPRGPRPPPEAQGGGLSATSGRVLVQAPLRAPGAGPVHPRPWPSRGRQAPLATREARAREAQGGPRRAAEEARSWGGRAQASAGPRRGDGRAWPPAAPAHLWSRPGGRSRRAPLGGALASRPGAALRMRGSPGRAPRRALCACALGGLARPAGPAEGALRHEPSAPAPRFFLFLLRSEGLTRTQRAGGGRREAKPPTAGRGDPPSEAGRGRCSPLGGGRARGRRPGGGPGPHWAGEGPPRRPGPRLVPGRQRALSRRPS